MEIFKFRTTNIEISMKLNEYFLKVLAKKLVSGAHWNSCLAIHPKGDNVLVGSYDKRICWFDLDLANTPYKTLRYHEKAIRQVVFHKKYPLFASCSDDGSFLIF